jgi:glycosyltransferase involved in cell wall biosynthesis
MKKLCFVATIPAVVHSFLKGHIRAAAKRWSVKIVSSPADAELLSDLDVPFIPLAIERKVSPWRDLLALIQLVILFRREHFDLVHSIMPKTGLLAMLAGWLARVPNRIHTFTGQVWATKRGWKRVALKMFDKLIVSLATRILVDGILQRDFLVAEGVLPRGKGVVIGRGSICGVDAARFHPDMGSRSLVRQELGISSNDIVLLFLGRLNQDKGILDLAAAFARIVPKHPNVVLILVGSDEGAYYSRLQEICYAGQAQLRRITFTPNPEHYMAAADIFCLPSYREGFSQTIIEAAASQVPAVASNIYGIADAVNDGETGLLFPPGDVTALTEALLELIERPDLRQQMGRAAQQHAVKFFSGQKITGELVDIYSFLLEHSKCRMR